MTPNSNVSAARVASRTFIAALLAIGVIAPEPAHAEEPTRRVVYAGRIEDSQGRPIGGIYPLAFAFYKTEKGGRPTWSESHFVAVDNGVYAVELGRSKSLPKNVDLSKVWIGVAISGGKEIVREKFAGDVIEAPASQPIPVAAPQAPSVGVAPQPAKGTYADLAGFAYEAEKAKTADTIGGMTANDIKNLAKQAQSTSSATAQAKPKIGQASRFTDAAGGPGGTEFTLQCPPGHVATGIRGRGAAMIDQLSVICSPLE